MEAVFRNPQSILCGLIAGLMFMPTTIFDMVWGVRFLQESHDVPYCDGGAALGLGAVRLDHRLPAARLALRPDRPPQAGDHRRRESSCSSASCCILYGPPELFPPYSLGLSAGIASGAAMLPYTVIKEANRPEHSGTATGVINFINFSFSALLGPVFGGLLMRVSGGGERELGHYQAAFEPLLYGVGLAIVLTLFLRETGAGRPRRIAARDLTCSK